MITLKDIFSSLEYGELSQFKLTGAIDDTTNKIQEKDYPLIISFVNRALLALHKELRIRERQVTLDVSELLAFYPLESQYARSRKDEFPDNPHFIADSEDFPFTDDIIKITEVSDLCGYRPLNDEDSCRSVFLPKYNVIQIPEPVEGNALFVLYQAKHPEIPETTTDLTGTELDVPDYCSEPILAYVTSKLYSRSMNQEHQAMAAQSMMRYVDLVQLIKREGTLGTDPKSNTCKLIERGFV